jgi:hypothetical protein
MEGERGSDGCQDRSEGRERQEDRERVTAKRDERKRDIK